MMPFNTESATMCQTSRKPVRVRSVRAPTFKNCKEYEAANMVLRSKRSAMNPARGGMMKRGAIAAKVMMPTHREESVMSSTSTPRATTRGPKCGLAA